MMKYFLSLGTQWIQFLMRHHSQSNILFLPKNNVSFRFSARALTILDHPRPSFTSVMIYRQSYTFRVFRVSSYPCRGGKVATATATKSTFPQAQEQIGSTIKCESLITLCRPQATSLTSTTYVRQCHGDNTPLCVRVCVRFHKL